MINWTQIEDEQQILDLKKSEGKSIIFKHSTRCSISMMAKKRLDLDADIISENIKCYFLDLISYRNISNKIAELFEVHHESPQLLTIKNGECILDQSHGEINLEEAIQELNRA